MTTNMDLEKLPAKKGYLYICVLYVLKFIVSLRFVVKPIVTLIQISRLHFVIGYGLSAFGWVISVVFRLICQILKFLKHVVVASWNWAVLFTIFISLALFLTFFALSDYFVCRDGEKLNPSRYCTATFWFRVPSLPLLIYWIVLFVPFVVWKFIVFSTGCCCASCRDAVIICEISSLRTAMYKCCRDILRGPEQ